MAKIRNLCLAQKQFICIDIRSLDHNGHPFMTSTRMGEGEGSGGRMWTGEGVHPHVDVHTEN